jgi:hypothetical protein
LDVLNIKLLTVQIKGSNTQFSTPSYLPPGQKKRGVSGHINYRWSVDAKWETFAVQKRNKNATAVVMQISKKYRYSASFSKGIQIELGDKASPAYIY